jgi:hypothetical protein
MGSLMVERYCGGYCGADCHNESTSVADASATTTDDTEDDVEAFSSSLSVFSSSRVGLRDVMVLPKSSGAIELKRSVPRPACVGVATFVDI